MVINCQGVPTDVQLQCINDTSTAQALEITNDCENADLSDVSAKHNKASIIHRLQLFATVELVSTVFKTFTKIVATTFSLSVSIRTC